MGSNPILCYSSVQARTQVIGPEHRIDVQFGTRMTLFSRTPQTVSRPIQVSRHLTEYLARMNAMHAPPVGDMEPNATKLADQRASEEAWGSLIREIASGDQEALGTLYDASSPMVYGLALRIVGNPATAEEVTLDVYTQVWRQAANYDTGRGSASAWLITLTRSRSIDRLRARDHTRPVLTEDQTKPEASATPEETTVLTERRRLVQAA